MYDWELVAVPSEPRMPMWLASVCGDDGPTVEAEFLGEGADAVGAAAFHMDCQEPLDLHYARRPTPAV